MDKGNSRLPSSRPSEGVSMRRRREMQSSVSGIEPAPHYLAVVGKGGTTAVRPVIASTIR